MRILDRYLFSRFLQAYLVIFVAMVGLYIVIDLFANYDEFMEEGISAGEFLVRISHYYSLHCLEYFARLSPIIAQAAAMYSLAEFHRNNELVPILAAGVPTRRALVPILQGVLLVIALGWANREYLLPMNAEFLQRPHDDVTGNAPQVVGARFDSEGMLMRADTIKRNERRLNKVKLTLPDLTEITAASALFRPDRLTGKNGLILEEPKSSQSRLPEKITPMPDGRWFVHTDLSFAEVSRGASWTLFASTQDLLAEINKNQSSNHQEVRAIIHSRFMQPVAMLILVMMGIPFVLTWDRKSVYRSLALSMTLSAAYLLVDAVSVYLAGLGYVEAPLAAWLPILMFGPIAAAMWKRVGT